jgi:Kef-type K+ transport system membrane component KefB
MLDDVWLWLGIALLLSVGQSLTHFMLMFVYLAGYALLMLCVLKPLLQRWYAARAEHAGAGVVLVFVSLVCFSAMLTDLIGLHPLLGAFVAGVIFPKPVLAAWRESLMQFSQLLLLPFYFILTGMRLTLDLGDSTLWLLAVIVTLVAVLCKFASVCLSARCTGLSWRDSAMLGSLMQCKGLMELVAINIFFSAGIIGAQIYAALAMMALISTLITAPAIALLRRRPQAAVVPAGGVAAV